MGDHLGAPGSADINQSGTPLQEHVSQVNGRQTLSRRTGSGIVWTVFWTPCWRLLQSGVRLSQAQNSVPARIAVESPLKCALPLMI